MNTLLALLLAFVIWLPTVGNGAPGQAPSVHTDLGVWVDAPTVTLRGAVANHTSRPILSVRVVGAFYLGSNPVGPAVVLPVFSAVWPGQERTFTANVAMPMGEWSRAEMGLLWNVER
jgi:hypothetical protein